MTVKVDDEPPPVIEGLVTAGGTVPNLTAALVTTEDEPIAFVEVTVAVYVVPIVRAVDVVKVRTVFATVEVSLPNVT